MNSTQNRITLDRETSEQTGRLKRSLKQVRFSRALMKIFWTAGPVTGLGLIGGFYIGYGTLPSAELLIYFISFTVFSGLIGLIAKVIYDGTRGYLKEQGQRDLLNLNNKLGDLILATRDLVVQGFEGDLRNIEAPLQLLRRVDLTPYGVSIAFTDLTGSREIGEVMGKMYAYRRIGLYSRVRELFLEHKTLIDDAVSVLNARSPYAARELADWFSGNASLALKQGVNRESHFLQRVMSAIEFSNPFLMTIRDVEEMLVLAFELINGRQIPTLVFSYKGKWKYAKSLDHLEKKRSQYRVAQARGGNRMRALASYLRETGVTDYEELPTGLTMPELIDKVTQIISRFADELDRPTSKQKQSKVEFRRNQTILKTAIDFYVMAREGYKEMGKRHEQLMDASESWNKVTADASRNQADLRIGSGKRGLRIRDNVIELDEEAKLEVGRLLTWYFEKEGFTGNVYQWLETAGQRDPEHQGELIRRLAIEIALTLEPHIGLSKPEIQRNINATKASYLGGISPYMNAEQKAELGRLMAREADNSPSVAAEQLAEALVRLYQVELNEEAAEFLQYNYGARREVLDALMVEQKSPIAATSLISERPPMVPPAPSRWHKIANR